MRVARTRWRSEHRCRLARAVRIEVAAAVLDAALVDAVPADGLTLLDGGVSADGRWGRRKRGGEADADGGEENELKHYVRLCCCVFGGFFLV